MDIVTDLTAEAISYLTLFQDILKSKPGSSLSPKLADETQWGKLKIADILVEDLTPNLQDRIKDLIWHSATKAEFDHLSERYFSITLDLLKWLSVVIDTFESPLAEQKKTATEVLVFRPPFFWRERIRAVLYTQPEERIVLAGKLEYMPLQVILALAGKGKYAYHIRLYQLYEIPDSEKQEEYDRYDVLSSADRSIHKEWWNGKHDDAKEYLTKDCLLLRKLKKEEFPLPFETLFGDELIEISKARNARKMEWSMASTGTDDSTKEEEKSSACNGNPFDPLAKARDMKLMGIALSGGGIRSASFNLGILQRLANLNVLGQFDYISTVSGGGYIGTWLTSWIKRSGSFSKIIDRMCPDKSGDPLADEVRPVRWLRMFGNYLSPNVSIMSGDAWTSGMTWLRNTLINQTVLLLTLVTVLSFISDVYLGWNAYKNHMKILDPIRILCWSIFMLSIGSLLAGIAMRAFHKVDKKPTGTGSSKIWESFKLTFSILTNVTANIPFFLVIWTGFCALLISTYFAAMRQPPADGFTEIFMYVAGSAFAAFMGLAIFGNYHKRQDLILTSNGNVNAPQVDNGSNQSGRIVLAIILSSVVASAALAFLLGIFWMNINRIYSLICAHTSIEPEKMMLVIGVPVILEIFAISVIVRMALMGNLFPDYRREWWGRMGGYIHRFMLVWIAVSFASLVLPDLAWSKINKFNITLPVAWGGWAGIIGWGVKKAFESKEETPTKTGGFTAYFIKIVPFIFMIGFLLIGSWILGIINSLSPIGDFKYNLLITFILLCVTVLLSWRIGVNEFSLHHFYRNRLIRAFLGATRTRVDRIKTANAFTGFDTNDDILLSSMCVEKGYSGPFPIINAALNATVVSALDRQDRMAESFVFSPLYCGYDFSPTRPSTYNVDHVYEYGYRPTAQFSNENGGPTIGTAMAISGAAVNPNWGYHSSPLMAFLLTLFNCRLGWWIGNSRLDSWKNPDPPFGLLYLMRDLIGKSDISMDYVCLSDGGHFDNMGLYELVRRRCNYILLGDGEQDENAACEGLANAIRRCRIDFGVEINIDISAITGKKEHLVKGDIIYPGRSHQQGTLIYIKTCMTGDEPVDIREYALANTDFPQQSTGDQFFDEAQFESYRKLGYHSIRNKGELYL
jgi:hypothetical protein